MLDNAIHYVAEQGMCSIVVGRKAPPRSRNASALGYLAKFANHGSATVDALRSTATSLLVCLKGLPYVCMMMLSL